MPDPFSVLYVLINLFSGHYGQEGSGVGSAVLAIVLVFGGLCLGINALERWNRNG